MRVQVHDHAAHGRFHQLPVIDGFDVFLLDPLENLWLKTQLHGKGFEWTLEVVPCGVIPVTPSTWGTLKATYR